MYSIPYISIVMLLPYIGGAFIKVLLFANFFPAFHPKRIELARFPCKNGSFLTNSVSVSLRGHYTRTQSILSAVPPSRQPPSIFRPFEVILLLKNFSSHSSKTHSAPGKEGEVNITILRYDSFSQHAMATESF